MASGFLGHLMNNARESEQRRKEREAQMEQQRLEMMKQGYDVSDTPQLTPGQQMASALQRGLNYDAQRDDPTPTYIRNQFNADVIARDTADQQIAESKANEARQNALTAGYKIDNKMKQKELDDYQRRADAEISEIEARIAASESTTELNSLSREIKDYEFGMMKKLAPYDEEMRKLEKEKVTALIVSANQKFLETDEGTVFNVNLKDQTMTKIVDGSQTEEEKKLAKAVSYIRILSEIEDSGLDIDKEFVKMLGEEVATLLSGKSLKEMLESLEKKPEDLVNKNVYSLITGEPLSNTKENNKTAPEATVDPAPPAPPEGTTPMGQAATDKYPLPSVFKQSSEPPLLQLFDYLSDTYGQSKQSLIDAGRNRRAEQP